MKTEIGKFLAMNHNVIPQESMGEEWGPNNMLKWALSARDTKIAPIDTSLSNTGQAGMSITGGYGQVIDLTVTEEVINKAKLAEICKNECLIQVGITPQFLGDISPSETATGVAQGINRSVTQLKDLYESHIQTIEYAKYTMLEFARYLAIKNDQVEQVWVNDEGERNVFKIPSDLLIHQLGVYITSGMDENIVLENVRALAIQDNTMGSDALEKISILSSKSVAEIYSRLKDSSTQKQILEKQKAEQEQNNQMEILQKQEEQLRLKMEEDARQKQLDREHELKLAEIKVIGQSQFSEGNGYEELMKLRDQQLKEDSYYREMINKANERSLKEREIEDNNRINKQGMDSKEELEREKIQLQREKILADLKKSQNDVLIAKVNKP